MKKVLIVIDVVNGFINEGALSDKQIRRIIKPIKEKIENYLKSGNVVIAFRDSHEEDDQEFKVFPKHCVKGSFESELVEELLPYKNDMIIIDKNTTNGFKTEKFQNLIKNNKFSSIEVTGCCSDICVRDFIQSLTKYFAIEKISTPILVSKNCIDTFNATNHNADEINNNIIEEFKKIGVKILDEKNYKKNIISIKKVSNQKFLNLYEVKFKTENGEINYELVTRKEVPQIISPSLKVDAASVLPYQLIDNKIVVYLIKEYRYPVGEYIYEIPAGLINEGEDSLQTAVRELEEEIGASVVKIKRSETPAYTSAGMSDESIDFYQAEVNINKDRKLDEGEDIQVLPVTLEELEKLLVSENFGAQAKLQLRNFINEQKIQELENKIKDLEGDKT